MTQDFTAEQKLICVEREIKQRERVYPRLVATNKMLQSTANYELACMRAIADDCRKALETSGERLL